MSSDSTQRGKRTKEQATPHWSKEEENILRELAKQGFSAEEMQASKLKSRSVAAIVAKGNRMKLAIASKKVGKPEREKKKRKIFFFFFLSSD